MECSALSHILIPHLSEFFYKWKAKSFYGKQKVDAI